MDTGCYTNVSTKGCSCACHVRYRELRKHAMEMGGVNVTEDDEDDEDDD